MKTIVQKFSKRLLILGLGLTAWSGAQAQCAVSSGVTANSPNDFTVNTTLTFQPGWNAYINIDFGDGSSSPAYTGTSTSSSTSHVYTVNGIFLVTTTMMSYDPVDSTYYCTATDVDTIVVNMPCSVDLGPVSATQNGFLPYSYIFSTTVTSTNYYDLYWSVRDSMGGWVYGTSGGTTFNYTFPGNGMYSVQCTANALDSATMQSCTDSSYIWMPIDTGNGGGGPSGGGGCMAYFYMYQDSLNPATWYGVNASSGSSSLTYMWDFGDGSTSTLPYPTHTYAAPGNYMICLTVADPVDSCTSTWCDSSAAFRLSTSALIGTFIVQAPTGIKEVKNALSDTRLFPNPMADQSSLQFNSAIAANGKIEVVGILGNVLVSENVSITKGTNEFKVNTATLASGVYYINISANDHVLGSLKAVK
jgi:hypothetical protein